MKPSCIMNKKMCVMELEIDVIGFNDSKQEEERLVKDTLLVET